MLSGDLAFFVSSLVVLVDCCEWVCNRRARVVNARVRNLVCDCYDISLWCVHSLMFCFSHVVLGISWDRRLFVPRRYGSMIRCCLSFWFALRGVCWHLSLADTCGIRGIRLFFWGGGGATYFRRAGECTIYPKKLFAVFVLVGVGSGFSVGPAGG